jgi:hypothetical protein
MRQYRIPNSTIEELKQMFEDASEHHLREVNKVQAIKMLLPQIEVMLNKGYTVSDIASMLSEKGIVVTPVTLRAYLGKLKETPASKRIPTVEALDPLIEIFRESPRKASRSRSRVTCRIGQDRSSAALRQRLQERLAKARNRSTRPLRQSLSRRLLESPANRCRTASVLYRERTQRISEECHAKTREEPRVTLAE